MRSENLFSLLYIFQATKAGMRGMFRAFLSSNQRSLENIVRWAEKLEMKLVLLNFLLPIDKHICVWM